VHINGGKHQSALFVSRVVSTAGLLMQPSHTRLICRAHNRFTPSIALWQHFVVPNRPATHQQRHVSSASGAAQDGADTNSTNVNGTPLNVQDASGRPQSEAEVKKPKARSAEPEHANAEPRLRIIKKNTDKGVFHPYKTDASIQKNKQLREDARDTALAESDRLLSIARAAYDDAKEYTGVVVKPIVNATPVKESALPWCLRKTERAVAGMDR
jgi:non-canonical poly(A) RNA polymerase PAPD5/7